MSTKKLLFPLMLLPLLLSGCGESYTADGESHTADSSNNPATNTSYGGGNYSYTPPVTEPQVLASVSIELVKEDSWQAESYGSQRSFLVGESIFIKLTFKIDHDALSSDTDTIDLVISIPYPDGSSYSVKDYTKIDSPFVPSYVADDKPVAGGGMAKEISGIAIPVEKGSGLKTYRYMFELCAAKAFDTGSFECYFYSRKGIAFEKTKTYSSSFSFVEPSDEEGGEE